VPQDLAVDANCLISALLGGRAREIIFSGRFVLHAPQPTLFEVARHLPWIADRVGVSEIALFREYQLLPVIPCQPAAYDDQWRRATALIGQRDPLDVPLLALALAQSCAIWSDDRDFEGIEDIEALTTQQLLGRLQLE
jgi:predicted nucleic acid-binding protein